MDIQGVFYWFATIAMAMTILFLLGMVVLLFYIKKKISDIDRYGKYVIHTVDHIVEGLKGKVNELTHLGSTPIGKTSK